MDKINFQFNSSIKEKFGVLCGAERSQEWLLPWWWSRYRDHNAFPVTFIDFGMSDEMRAWAKERGEVIAVDLDPSCIASRSQIDSELAKQWEKLYGWKVWNARLTWFKKPFALLQSPYEKGIWIDLDCEVLGSLKSLFTHCDPTTQLALVREPSSDPANYNAGVVVFQHGANILEKWAEDAISRNHLFGSDERMLSSLIHAQQLEIQELPEIYNWRMARGLNLNAVILRWVGSEGKKYIRKQGGLKPALDAFYCSFDHL